MNNEVIEIVKGSFDLRVNSGPDTQERRLNVLDTARAAYEGGLGGFVLKSPDYPTMPLASVLDQMYPGLQVLGSITLNKSIGGINPTAVQVSADLGAKIVWMPNSKTCDQSVSDISETVVKIMDSESNILSEVVDVLDIIAAEDMVLASGHISHGDTIKLFEEAKIRGVKKMIAAHPFGNSTNTEMEEIASTGAYIEFAFLSCMPTEQTMSPRIMCEQILQLGVEKCLVTTDFGNWTNPPPAEGMRMAVASLLDSGMSVNDVTKLVKHNPQKIIS